MKYYSLFISASIFLTGCFASMPSKINSEYLNNKSPEETEKLEAIEKRIIAISDSKDEIKKSLKVVNLKISVTEKEISQYEGKKGLLEDKNKLHMAENNTAKVEETKKEIEENGKKLNLEQLKLKYYKTKKEDQEAQIELNEAELAAKVAEQRFEEAKIGRANQDKALGPVDPKKKDDDGRINVADYEKYYKSQQENLTKEQKDRKSTADEFKKAETALKGAGFTEEL
ncbi:MAG: hypothetical protein GY754_00535 [bacterium]|nr:hypothetical protein [bacterium]